MAKILIFVPMYNCEKQIPRVIDQLAGIQDSFDEAIIIDNRSVDNSIDSAKEAILSKELKDKVKVLQNSQNYSLGGSHKVAFQYAFEHNYDYVIVTHGDAQGDINDVLPSLKELDDNEIDCYLGARFHKDSKLIGYPYFRIFGNLVVGFLCSLALKGKILDIGGGLNMYKVSSLKKSHFMNFPDNLTFNTYFLFEHHYDKLKMKYFPVTWMEEDQVSNAKLFKQTFILLKLILKYTLNKKMIKNQSIEKREYSYTRMV